MKHRYMSRIYLVVLSVFICLNAFSQRKAPGYMGKRFLLKYDQGISWSLGGDARGIPNLHYTLQGDLAVTKKFSVGAEYSFMTRKYEKELGRPGYGYYDTDRYYKLDRTYMHRVGIYTKLFSQRNGHLAPAGPYFATGLNLYFIQSRFSSYYSSEYVGGGMPLNHLSFDFAPFIGGGKQYVVANRMVISLDLRVSLPFIGLARAINGNLGLEGNAATSQQMLNRSMDRWATWPNAQANFIELRIGLGTLL